MMKKNQLKDIIKKIKFILPVLVLVSCVPAKQFEVMQDDYRKCDEERNMLNGKNEVLDVENTELKSRVSFLEKEYDVLVNDSIAKADMIKNLKGDKDRIRKRYEDIQTAQEALIKGNANETRRLLQELQRTQSDLQTREDRLRELENQLNQKRLSLNSLKAELDGRDKALEKKNRQLKERNARLIELEQVLHKKDSITAALKKRVQDALVGFKDKGLSVEIRRGKVYVSLDEKLLFKSGSTSVDQKGVSALKELSVVLAQNKNINVMVEGHTDDVPVNPNSALKDNWELSVRRATAIVRILLENKEVDAKRIIAAGRGEFMPVDPSKTVEARQKNRRTEIILTPKLDELLEILGN